MRAYFILLLAMAILLVNSIEVESVTTTSRQTKLNVASLDAIHANDVDPTRSSSKRFLRTHKNEVESAKGESNDADSEERGVQEIAKELGAKESGVQAITKKLGAKERMQAIAKKLASNAGTKWKMLTNKDFRNYKLFLNGASFEKLYEKGAVPFTIFTQLSHYRLPKSETRWDDYFNYWVDRNIARQLGQNKR